MTRSIATISPATCKRAVDARDGNASAMRRHDTYCSNFTRALVTPPVVCVLM